jgi:hypothetical protein
MGKEVKTVFKIATRWPHLLCARHHRRARSCFYGARLSAPDGSFEVVSGNGLGGLSTETFFHTRRDMRTHEIEKGSGTKIGDPNINGDEWTARLFLAAIFLKAPVTPLALQWGRESHSGR